MLNYFNQEMLMLSRLLRFLLSSFIVVLLFNSKDRDVSLRQAFLKLEINMHEIEGIIFSLISVLSSERGINDQTFGEESSEIKDDEPMDCLSDRQTALSEQQNNKGLYVPECTPDGRYQKVRIEKVF